MNFSERHNAFSDIPGLDSSKGEPGIVKALQRIWAKIEHLEQIRISEKKSQSKEVFASPNDEDLTITDVQYKLLVLQLQYARSILRKKQNNSESSPEGITAENLLDQHKKNGSYIQVPKHSDSERKAVSQETQTGNSLIEDLTNFANQQDKFQTNAQVNASTNIHYKDVFGNTTSVSSRTLPTNTRSSSKPHYHLKLDDLPFILGASSGASHSLVANVQNIIALMKSHNKALCGPRQHSQKTTHIENIQAAVGDSQDNTKMINELSQDLYELALRQERLVKQFEAAQGKNQSMHPVKDFNNFEDKSKLIKTVETDQSVTTCPKRIRSYSESSSKLCAEVKNNSKRKEKDMVKHNAQSKQSISNTKSHSNDLPIMARRKFLRSLQNFKSHLSEEDISWE